MFNQASRPPKSTGFWLIMISCLAVTGVAVALCRRNQPPPNELTARLRIYQDHTDWTLTLSHSQLRSDDRINTIMVIENRDTNEVPLQAISTGQNLHIMYREMGSSSFGDIFPMGTYTAPKVTKVASGADIRAETWFQLPPGEYEIYYEYSVPEALANGCWSGASRSEPHTLQVGTVRRSGAALVTMALRKIKITAPAEQPNR